MQANNKTIFSLPSGNFFCSKNGKNYKWYLFDNHKQIPIPKKEEAYAKKCAYKKFLICQNKDLEEEKRGIDLYLNHYASHCKNVDQLLNKSSEYQRLLSDVRFPNEQDLVDWMNAPYIKNETHLENLNFKTKSGHLVRSKSEVLIDMILSEHRIPFRYECQLQLGDTYLYPDFTIKHPKTGKLFYWEHFGLMDNPTYRKNVCQKIDLYSSNGILPTVNLIMTFESHDEPLDISYIENLVAFYFS